MNLNSQTESETLSVGVVPPEESEWSILNSVSYCNWVRTKIIDWCIAGEVGDDFSFHCSNGNIVAENKLKYECTSRCEIDVTIT